MYFRQQEVQDETEGDTPETTLGLPRTPGLFYGAGVALIMEGVFSSCYHICPTLTNFQFDVAFMYMIAGTPFDRSYFLFRGSLLKELMNCDLLLQVFCA